MPLAVVTGASSGIGWESARLLAARGYRTLLLGRRRDRLEALAAELAPHAPAVPLVIDLGDPDAVDSLVAPLLRQHGPAAVLLNNAGMGQYSPFIDESPQEHRRLFEVNYFAAVAMIRAVLPDMVRLRRGHVINVASMAAKMGPWGHGGYAASKAAMACLTQSLAAEHANDGVHFSYVSPGVVDTGFFDAPCYASVAKRFGRHAISAARVAGEIVKLLDRPRLELWVPGHYRLFEWMRALAPGFAHRVVCRQSRPG
jgi:short-subunit dehydrogenase